MSAALAMSRCGGKMDAILGEEIVRIADDEPRFLYRSGKTLDDKGLNTLLKLSRYGIAVEDPARKAEGLRRRRKGRCKGLENREGKLRMANEPTGISPSLNAELEQLAEGAQ